MNLRTALIAAIGTLPATFASAEIEDDLSSLVAQFECVVEEGEGDFKAQFINPTNLEVPDILFGNEIIDFLGQYVDIIGPYRYQADLDRIAVMKHIGKESLDYIISDFEESKKTHGEEVDVLGRTINFDEETKRVIDLFAAAEDEKKEALQAIQASQKRGYSVEPCEAYLAV